MTQATADLFASPCLQFKGSMVPLTTLELLHFEPQKFTRDLAGKIQQAPNFFKNLPLVLSLDKFEGDKNNVDLAQLRQLCTEQSIQLVGIRTSLSEDIKVAEAAGLAILQPPKTRETSEEPSPGSAVSENNTSKQTSGTTEQAGNSDSPVVQVQTTTNKIIRTPVRSGQQVYAAGGDLIVLAQVSAGAEILADGNIHVYAPLRGRALAGVRGDTEANIFCQSLEAELVSVAGQYKISEDLQGKFWKKSARVMLQEEKLTIGEL